MASRYIIMRDLSRRICFDNIYKLYVQKITNEFGMTLYCHPEFVSGSDYLWILRKILRLKDFASLTINVPGFADLKVSSSYRLRTLHACSSEWQQIFFVILSAAKNLYQQFQDQFKKIRRFFQTALPCYLLSNRRLFISRDSHSVEWTNYEEQCDN